MRTSNEGVNLKVDKSGLTNLTCLDLEIDFDCLVFSLEKIEEFLDNHAKKEALYLKMKDVFDAKVKNLEKYFDSFVATEEKKLQSKNCGLNGQAYAEGKKCFCNWPFYGDNCLSKFESVLYTPPKTIPDSKVIKKCETSRSKGDALVQKILELRFNQYPKVKSILVEYDAKGYKQIRFSYFIPDFKWMGHTLKLVETENSKPSSDIWAREYEINDTIESEDALVEYGWDDPQVRDHMSLLFRTKEKTYEDELSSKSKEYSKIDDDKHSFVGVSYALEDGYVCNLRFLKIKSD